MMERDVQLSRSGEEPWGFRLIGGADFNMPLTVVKVLPDSPADLAGLRNGDTVSRIEGADAGPMTHDEAKAAVAAATDVLSLGVMRGLYDMAIDDYEPIDEPIDQDDFDQPSHPTEVFQIQEFTETPLRDDLSRSRTGSRGNIDVRSLSELRSTTESPFVQSTRPYRPFSTEPTPVPPLEDPIILNPAYHDEFTKVDDGPISGFDDDKLLKGFDGLDEVLSGKARFKLPISEQYDPDGTRTKKANEMSTVTVEERFVKEEITQVTKEVKVTSVQERLVKEQKDELKFMGKQKKEIDLDKIEMTASSIVDESIEKAVTVAGEIKKEIDRELSAITSESKSSSTEVVELRVTKKDKKESVQESNELIAMIDTKTDVLIKDSVAKEVSKFEADDKQVVVDERKAFIRQEIEETIESGSVRRKSEMYDKEVADVKVEKKSIDDIEAGSVRRKSEMYSKEVKSSDTRIEKKSIDDKETGAVKKKSEIYEKEDKTSNIKDEKKSIEDSKVERKQSKLLLDHNDVKEMQSVHEKQKSEIKSEKVSKTTETTQKSEENKSKEAKYTTAKLLAEQRAYTIGLQTIPHIRGTVQSTYHYDLLLKTFFIHLTDVMVALSRFILAEPVLSQPLETKQEAKKEVTEVVQVKRDVTAATVAKESLVDHKKVEKVGVEETHIQNQRVEKIVDIVNHDEMMESRRQEYFDYADRQFKSDNDMKKMMSGAEMSQLSEKKSAELISKMGGVITEFQTKAGLEEEIIMQRERRSRSRSRIGEEEVKIDTDQLEKLSKVDMKTQDSSEIKTTSSVSESMEMKTETRLESKEVKRESKHETHEVISKDDKSTYIAIVEAHVYTNKNLLEEIAEISETASVESIEETNIAREANEAMVTERVALKSKAKQEIAQFVESHELSSAEAEEVIVQEKKDIVQEIDTQKSFVEVETTKEVAEIQLVETALPIVELHEDIVEKTLSVETKNEMDIQEIQTSEYISELDVVKEEFVELVQDIQEIKEVHDEISEEVQEVKISEQESAKVEEDVSIMKNESVETVTDVQEIKKVHDVQISHKVQKIEISEQVSAKIEEDISIMSEEVISSTTREELIIQEKKDIDVQKSFVEVESKKEIGEIQVIETIQPDVELQEEIISVKEEAITVHDMKVEEVIENIIVEEEMSVIKESMDINGKGINVKNEHAQLKITKEEITKIDENVEINQEIEFNIKKSVHISESENKYQSFISESSVQSSEIVQESTFIAKSIEDAKKQLTLDLNSQIKKSDSQSSVKSTISTPTPSTVPPTPLTDEYLFRLEIPLPKITGPPIPRSPSPEDEDPHIVKKNLVPHIETAIVEEVVYETPLPTPPEDKSSPPRFTKPGLKGGDMRYVKFYKEEIKEIERKSSLLASAIDETIKSIEEYKEEVGINKVENPAVYNGYSKVIESKVYKEKLDEINIERQIVQNTENINRIVENRANSEESIKKVNLNGKAATVTVVVENNVANSVAEATENKMDDAVETLAVEGYRPVAFKPEDAPHLQKSDVRIPKPIPTEDPGKAFVTENGEIIGTHQGIVDGLEDPVVDQDVTKEMGKPGMTEEKIAELISGESEMLREAHVMGLTRVLKSHMHRDDDDSSVDFKKIKPIVESLKDSEVLKALNEEFMKTQEEKKKEERKWTKFLQKPARPVPKAKFGHQGWTAEEETAESPYKVKIVKQPKPKIAPDYKPQDFNTGPLPWEERAQNEPPPPPLEAEAPILVPEESPQFLEALDTLPESEVPDLEETGISLPPEPVEEPTPEPETEPEVQEVQEEKEEEAKLKEEPVTNSEADMENRVTEQLMKNVEGMVDPNAPLEQQLAQMRAQLAALAQLPGVIQQTLELVTRQLCQITQQESQSHQSVTKSQMAIESSEMIEEANETSETTIEDVTEEVKEETQEAKEETQIAEVTENGVETVEEVKEVKQQAPRMSAEEREKMKREEEEILGEQRRIEKQKKEIMAEMVKDAEQRPQTPREIALRFINELMAELQLDQESRQLKQRPTPRVGKPKPVFGPLTPAERPVVLPGGRKWRKPKDAYNDQFINETLTAQAELIQGKALGKTYESVHLPYDERVNFMKYEKPPITLDHLQNSDVYKLIHNMEQAPPRQVAMLTPVIAEADYREKCRSITPCAERIG